VHLEPCLFTVAGNLDCMFYAMLPQASTSKISAEDGNEKLLWLAAAAGRYNQSAFKFVRWFQQLCCWVVFCTCSWDWCHKEHQKIMKQKPPSLCRERAQNLEKGENELTSMSKVQASPCSRRGETQNYAFKHRYFLC